MSIRAMADRKILLNNTNMDNLGDDTTNKATWSGVNGVSDAEGVRTDSTPPAASPVVLNSTIGAQPVGVVIHCSRTPRNTLTRKDCSRSTHGCLGKFGSSDQEAKERAEDRADPAAKKRKTRRGKPKHRKLKPYTKQTMSYEQRLRCRAVGRLTKTGGHPPAPYNTTQFLMEDHSDLPDFDKKLADAITSEVPASFQKPLAPPRTRDSSFSIDSEDDYFYSSPENEEEFLTKEFSSAYEDLHAERLNTLTKSELIQEYVQLEAKLDILTKRLRGKNIQQIDERESASKNCAAATATTATVTAATTTTTTTTTTMSTTTSMTTPTSDNEMAKKLKICQQRMDDLMQQNEQLRRDNEALRAKHCSSPISSVDSESDSESTSGGNPSSCSCSPGSSGSPITTAKPFQSRRKKDYRRSNKRLSSVDSDNSSASTASSEDSSCTKPEEGSNYLIGEVVNGKGTHPGGLPT